MVLNNSFLRLAGMFSLGHDYNTTRAWHYLGVSKNSGMYPKMDGL